MSPSFVFTPHLISYYLAIGLLLPAMFDKNKSSLLLPIYVIPSWCNV